ncbi:HIT family protein [Mesoplasma syrphidae]|uniref:HIT family protein n=1 Tax=Mesoplasma syrphidae TaxID=225999 RepID=A0A2K9BYH9_9MOLU|nr:HIT family protein [Mesoplasma syrphidae]AUF83428.1 HIT family protein [Mesoplasma syrphidae]
MNCLFCKIINQEIPSYKIYENEFVYAFLDINPASNGHTLVIPKNHSENFSDAKQADIIEVVKAKQEIIALLDNKLKPAGYNFISNQNQIAGQMVFHYHEHIIPKYDANEGYIHGTKQVNVEPLENTFNKFY